MPLAFKTWQYAPLNERPYGIPLDWPYEVRDLGDSTQLPEGDGWVLATLSELNDYRLQRANSFATYQASNPKNLTLLELTLERDERHRRFAQELISEIKLSNQQASIPFENVLHLQSRLRALEVHHPSGRTYTIDLINLVVSGDVETAFHALSYVTPDDMTQSWHWLSASLLLNIRQRMASFLGVQIP